MSSSPVENWKRNVKLRIQHKEFERLCKVLGHQWKNGKCLRCGAREEAEEGGIVAT
jgi:hypothetical protein